MTRRQVDAWFFPIRKAFAEIKAGEVDCVDGYAVTRLSIDDEFVRIDWCIEAWVCCLNRLFPAADLSAMVLIKQRLADNEGVTTKEVDAALRLLRSLEKPLMTVPWAHIKGAVLDEQIAIEVDRLKLGAA